MAKYSIYTLYCQSTVQIDFSTWMNLNPRYSLNPVTCPKPAWLCTVNVFVPINRLLTSQYISFIALQLRPSLFWDVGRRRGLAVAYRPFGTTYLSHLQVSISRTRKILLAERRFEATFIGTVFMCTAVRRDTSCAQRCGEILLTCSIIFELIRSIVYEQPTK